MPTVRVLARSDNSLAEQMGTESVFAAAGIQAYGLQRSVFRPQDFYTLNTKDAGFRVVLPGAAGGEATYHVRVRSSSPTVNVVAAGQTSGVYQLQVRLQDLDEFPGSTVQYADIRYAVDGIRVKGLPRHSPLAGETSEDSGFAELNDDSALPRNSKILLRATYPPGGLPDFKDVQSLGNILASDRATISLAGKLESLTLDQADWYMFEVTYESLQQAGGNTLDVSFDLDYGDGLGRADITLSVYEAEFIDSGNPSGPEVQPTSIIFSSRDSAVADDQPGPLEGDDLDDLSRGSVGKLDPFLGPVSLAEGYYLVKLEPTTFAPTELGQFTSQLPTNPYIRSEPIDSMVRVAQDNLGDGPLISAPFDPPQFPVLLNPNSAVPFHLGDVELFVTTANSMFTVDPFTGVQETTLGGYAGDIPAVGTLSPDDRRLCPARQSAVRSNVDRSDHRSSSAVLHLHARPRRRHRDRCHGGQLSVDRHRSTRSARAARRERC